MTSQFKFKADLTTLYDDADAIYSDITKANELIEQTANQLLQIIQISEVDSESISMKYFTAKNILAKVYAYFYVNDVSESPIEISTQLKIQYKTTSDKLILLTETIEDNLHNLKFAKASKFSNWLQEANKQTRFTSKVHLKSVKLKSILTKKYRKAYSQYDTNNTLTKALMKDLVKLLNTRRRFTKNINSFDNITRKEGFDPLWVKSYIETVREQVVGVEDYNIGSRDSVDNLDPFTKPIIVSAILNVFEHLPKVSELVVKLFTLGCVDFSIDKSKLAGGMCVPTSPTTLPIVLGVLDGQSVDDVYTSSHELGHAIHVGYVTGDVDTPHEFNYTMSEVFAFLTTLLTQHELISNNTRYNLTEPQVDALKCDIFNSTLSVLRLSSRSQAYELALDGMEHNLTTRTATDLLRKYQLKSTYNATTMHIYLYPHYMWKYVVALTIAVSLFKRYINDPASFMQQFEQALSVGFGSGIIRSLDKFNFNLETDIIDPIKFMQEYLDSYMRL